MSLEQNAQIAREAIEAPLREDWDRLRELYAEDAVIRGTPEPVHGPEAIMELWQGCMYKEVPGLRGEIMNVVAQDDLVVVEWRVGKDLEGAEMHICQLRDGKIIANRIYGGSL